MSPLNLDSRTLDRTPGGQSYARQLADHLRQAIATGDLAPGDPLPSEHTIGGELGVSRTVVRNALDTLDREGLIVRRSGMPTRVAPRPPVRTMGSGRYLDVLDQLRAGNPLGNHSALVNDYGAKWDDFTVDPIEFSEEQASGEDARLLRIDPGSPILRRRMVKNLSGEPMEIHRSAIPLGVAKGTALMDLSRHPVPGGTVAEFYAIGLDIQLAQHQVRGRAPNATERRLLQMQSADWVWDIVRVFTSGGPVEASRTIAPMSRNILEFEIDLSPRRPPAR